MDEGETEGELEFTEETIITKCKEILNDKGVMGQPNLLQELEKLPGWKDQKQKWISKVFQIIRTGKILLTGD